MVWGMSLIQDSVKWKSIIQKLVWTPYKSHQYLKLMLIKEKEEREEQEQEHVTDYIQQLIIDKIFLKITSLRFKEQIWLMLSYY